jgi:hypothetical protein
MIFGLLDSLQDLVGDLHRHTAEIGYEMSTLSVTRKTTFC